LESFGDWVEQLIAESTGKEGRGILPVVGETIGTLNVYGNDRLFIHLQLGAEMKDKDELNALVEAGHPAITIHLKDLYDLGEQFFLWEMATAIAGYCLKINPFDQPNVESSKVLTRKMLKDYQENGRLLYPEPVIVEGGMTVYGNATGDSIEKVLQNVFRRTVQGSYVCIQAYLKSSLETDINLDDLRIAIRNKTQLATTLGYGPRFLHSTGQLHKGDAGNGLFIQITADMQEDVVIPDEAGKVDGSITFGILKTAQVLGDYQALLEAKRNVLRIDLGSQQEINLKKIISIICSI